MVRRLVPRITLCVLVDVIATPAGAVGSDASATTPSSSLLFAGTVFDND